MFEHVRSLSRQQGRWVMLSLVGAVLICIFGYLHSQHGASSGQTTVVVDTTMSLKEAARLLGTTGKGLARELDLPVSINKKVPMSQHGVRPRTLTHAVEHVQSHRPATMKYFVFLALCLLGLSFLVCWGRPANSPVVERAQWYPHSFRLVVLVLSVVGAGFALGKSPNPMEGVVKVFKAGAGLYPDMGMKVLYFLFFMTLAIIGTKLICSWACPMGSLQELVYSIPWFRKLQGRKLPFWLTNTVRTILFIATMLLLFGLYGNRKGFVLYHGLNPFNLFDWHLESMIITATVVVTLLLAAAFYRPFCHLVCPFGLVSWLVEPCSLYKVQVDRQRCTTCRACTRACPTEAAAGIIDRKAWPADCHSCARCLRSCPEDALSYGRKPPTAG